MLGFRVWFLDVVEVVVVFLSECLFGRGEPGLQVL